jgi:hypothetical protein
MNPNQHKEYYLVLKAQYDWNDKYYLYDLMYLEDGKVITNIEYARPLEWMDDAWKKEA